MLNEALVFSSMTFVFWVGIAVQRLERKLYIDAGRGPDSISERGSTR